MPNCYEELLIVHQLVNKNRCIGIRLKKESDFRLSSGTIEDAFLICLIHNLSHSSSVNGSGVTVEGVEVVT